MSKVMKREPPVLPNNKFATVPEVGSYLRISKGRAYKFVESGELPCVRIGRSIRIPLDALRSFEAARQSGTGEVVQ